MSKGVTRQICGGKERRMTGRRYIHIENGEREEEVRRGEREREREGGREREYLTGKGVS